MLRSDRRRAEIHRTVHGGEAVSLDLKDIFPQIGSAGIQEGGFLFGCGTSKDAGYPLMNELTQEIVAGLNSAEKRFVDDLLLREHLSYDAKKGEPDIEIICDLLERTIHANPTAQAGALEQKFRSEILRVFLECGGKHDLALHVRFFNALRARAGSNAGRVWIFTTNYDVLFELAAAEANMPIETGFDGAVERFFDPTRLASIEGTTEGQRFRYKSQIQVVLVKLHGSLSWIKREDRIIETALGMQPSPEDRLMILPRKSKVVDTLEPPYDSLFSYSSKILGNECKYLVSCGFGFRDQHINDNLLTPNLANNRLRLFALYGKESRDLSELTRYQSFHYVTPEERRVGGISQNDGSELWRFEKLVELLEG